MREFAGGEDAVKSIRWLEYEDTGKFKGCGFVQFHSVVRRTLTLTLTLSPLCVRCIAVVQQNANHWTPRLPR